jgi:DNA-binding SARP family transcriptional activator
MQRREFTPAIGLCQKVLARDNCNEQAYRRLIQCFLEQGQRQLAMREYQTCLQTLKEELNLAPSAETRAMYRQIVG